MPYSWVTETVYVVHTPGHSKESISLLDTENQLLLTGDYLYTGPLYVYLPGASMQDYLRHSAHLAGRNPWIYVISALTERRHRGHPNCRNRTS